MFNVQGSSGVFSLSIVSFVMENTQTDKDDISTRGGSRTARREGGTN